MARYRKLQVLNEIIEKGLMPLFFHHDLEISKKIIDACVKGGIRTIEFTNRGDHAWEVFSQLEKMLAAENSPVMLGVGTVDDAPTAAMYIGSGANFVVGPTFNEEVARLCNRRKIPYFPGCATVNEIATAEEWGVDICKVFPGSTVGGPAFIKAIHGPRPSSLIMPTGGVEVEQSNITEWFKAGAVCVGLGSNLINKKRLAEGDYEAITRDIQQALTWVKEARS